jgi:transposase
MAARTTAWAGIDVGKTSHWICAVDAEGRPLLSLKVANVEADLQAALAKVTDLAAEVVWALDIIGAPSALILALLAQADASVSYASGRVVNTMSGAFTGEGKTDAKDAHVIAETVRLRRDLPVVDTVTDLTRELALLTGHRTDLIADRVRMINRLRDVLTSIFPTLEQAFDYSSHKGALILLSEYANPHRLRRLGEARLTQWLRRRHVRDAAGVAARALTAAHGQHLELPGQHVAEMIVAELAAGILRLDDRVKVVDQQIAATFHRHHQAETIESMPGFGPILGAQLLVAAGDLRAFPSAGHLAAAAGLVPVPNDSGRRSGNLHKPRRYSRPLRHVFYLSAQTSMMREGPNRDYYLKKRGRGHTHTQAVISLARRRIDVLWALLRDERTFTIEPPTLAAAA